MPQADDWALMTLDETMAKRHGMPARIPVPKADYEQLAESGLGHEVAQRWIRQFLGKAGASWRAQNAGDAKAFDCYIAKMAPWKKAQTAFEKRDFEAAIRSLILVTNVDRNDFAAKQSLATAYAACGKAREALELFDQIAEVWDGVAEFHVAYANACLIGSRKDDAIEHFVRALEADAECRPALEGLVGLGVLVKLYEDPLDASSRVFVRSDSVVSYLTSEWEKASPGREGYLRQAAYHEEEQRFDVMLAAAEGLLKENPTDELAPLIKARALRKLGQIEPSEAAVNAFLSANPHSASGYVERAECALVRNDSAAAALDLDQALEHDPGHLAALSLRFFPSDPTDLGALQASLPELRNFVERHPNCAGALRMLARAEARAGATDESFSSFAKAIALDPDDDDLRAEYWTELAKNGKFSQVLEDAESISNMGQRDWKLRWSEAEALNGLGKRAEARAAYTAINADPSLHVAIRARAKRAVLALTGGGP